MRILIISRNSPRKNGFGIQMRIFKHIEALKNFGEVRLLILQAKADDYDAIAHQTEISGIANKPDNEGLGLLASPENAPSPLNSELDFVNEHLKSWKPDLFFCFRLDSARILESSSTLNALKNSLKILDLDDIESKAAIRAVKSNYKVYGRIYTLRKFFDSIKLKAIERKAFKNFDNTLICSTKDQKDLYKHFGSICDFKVIPNTIDLQEQLPDQTVNENKINLLFVGTMSYHPNVRAIEYFIKEIYPLAKQLTNINLHLYIVGHKPPERIRKLNEAEDITVTGGVNSVIPYYLLSNIVICPILSGGGTRIKIIEAMSLNRPVISTTLGAEGLNVKNELNILLADNPQDFASCILRLTEQPDLRNKIAKEGVDFATCNYSTKILPDIFQELLQKPLYD